MSDNPHSQSDDHDDDFMRANAEEYLQKIQAVISASLSFEKLTEEDRTQLLYAQEHLRISYEQITKHFIDTRSHAYERSFGYNLLWTLMTSSFLAGSRATISESGKILASNLAQSERGKKGQETHAERRAEWTPTALRLARSLRKRDSEVSQQNLIIEMLSKWSDQPTVPKRPTFGQLEKFIREAEENGDLPRTKRGEAYARKKKLGGVSR